MEDAREARETLTDLLEDSGYRVAAAANGAEALKYLESQPAPALILTDLMMPVMTGWELTGRLKQNPALASIPIVALTAVRNVDDFADLVPFQERLIKPVVLEDVLEVVARYCCRSTGESG